MAKRGGFPGGGMGNMGAMMNVSADILSAA